MHPELNEKQLLLRRCKTVPLVSSKIPWLQCFPHMTEKQVMGLPRDIIETDVILTGWNLEQCSAVIYSRNSLPSFCGFLFTADMRNKSVKRERDAFWHGKDSWYKVHLELLGVCGAVGGWGPMVTLMWLALLWFVWSASSHNVKTRGEPASWQPTSITADDTLMAIINC